MVPELNVSLTCTCMWVPHCLLGKARPAPLLGGWECPIRPCSKGICLTDVAGAHKMEGEFRLGMQMEGWREEWREEGKWALLKRERVGWNFSFTSPLFLSPLVPVFVCPVFCCSINTPLFWLSFSFSASLLISFIFKHVSILIFSFFLSLPCPSLSLSVSLCVWWMDQVRERRRGKEERGRGVWENEKVFSKAAQGPTCYSHYSVLLPVLLSRSLSPSLSLFHTFLSNPPSSVLFCSVFWPVLEGWRELLFALDAPRRCHLLYPMFFILLPVCFLCLLQYITMYWMCL